MTNPIVQLPRKLISTVGAGFGLALALIVALTLVGLHQLAATSAHLESIVKENSVKTRLANQMRDILRDRAISMLTIVVSSDPFEKDEEMMRFYGYGSAYQQVRLELDTLIDRPEEKAVLTGIDRRAGTETETKEAAYAGSPGFSAESATMTLIRSFLLVISALIVGAFFTVWTLQRSRQIGLLKAMGATTGYVVRDALGQLAIVLLLAVGAGALVAFGVGAVVPAAVPFSLQASSALTSAALLAVIGMAGSLVAVRRIASVDPIVALSTEN